MGDLQKVLLLAIAFTAIVSCGSESGGDKIPVTSLAPVEGKLGLDSDRIRRRLADLDAMITSLRFQSAKLRREVSRTALEKSDTRAVSNHLTENGYAPHPHEEASLVEYRRLNGELTEALRRKKELAIQLNGIALLNP